MGEEAEVREFLKMLGRVERYIRYLDMRAHGNTYLAWGLAVVCGSIASFTMPLLGEAIGVPVGPLIGLVWLVALVSALTVSWGSWARASALMLARKPREERERLKRAVRREGALIGVAWAILLMGWSMSVIVLAILSGACWALYMACVGLGNLATYAISAQKEREALYVGASLVATSPAPLAAYMLAPEASWLPFTIAVVAVVASYLWAATRFYGRARAILAEAEGVGQG
ncbi:MAG TPA: hypothetical protein ENF78_03930 [Candidatus Bathyarchaeota archaeon]|nr:hypothetical protein [Candidatus Bathyarchaeota archaeon]